ncbi:MAG: PilZ domain-containing protein [Sphingopyxis sp.]
MSIDGARYAGLDQRASPRTDVYARLPLVLADNRTATATAVNISADGLLIRFEQPMVAGHIITLSLPIIGRVKAMVVWSIGGMSGLQFCAAIEPRDYTALLRGLGAKIEN